MGIVTKPEVKSSFVVMKLDKDGNEIYRSAEIQNQITDYCYQQIFGLGTTNVAPGATTGSNKYYFRYLRLGKGTGEITPDATGITDPSVYADGESSSTPNNFRFNSVTYNGENYIESGVYYTFPLGQFNSETFTQLGIFRTTGTNSLMCGQRLRDVNGDPVSLTILSDEQLVIAYTFRLKTIRIGDNLGSFNFNYEGEDYNVSLEQVGEHMFFGSTMRTPISNSSYNYTVNRTQYQNRVEYLVQFNFGILDRTTGIDILSLRATSNARVIDITFTPPLPKTDQNTLTFSFRWTVKWRDL